MQKLPSRRGILRYVGSITIALVLTAGIATAGPSLSVRVVNLAGLDAQSVTSALTVAAERYERIGITLGWTVCGGCRHPLQGGDVWLRIAPASKRHGAELGVSAVDPRTGAGVVATVYPEAIRTLARDAGGSFERLLGTVIAHEVGHLLLGSSRHAKTGVMQRGWSPSEVRSLQPPEFSSGEGLALRARLAGRDADD